MFCKNCGQPVNKGSEFCKSCGSEVKFSRFLIIKTRFFGWLGRHRRGLVVVGLIIAFVIITSSLYKSSLSDQEVTAPDNFNPISSVVNILCTAKNSGESSGGSGTIITKEGLILTNAHVIPQIRETPNVLNDECLVVLPDEATGQPKEIYLAKPEITKGLSKQYDVATLQIDSVYIDEDGKSWGTFPNTFPEFQDGPECEEKSISLGDQIRIFGYPVTSGGYNLTVTDGIVSSFNDDGTILTSAKIDSGNSGGLAMDGDGCFIGIPSAIAEGDYQNLGVIIPPDLIREFSDKLENFDGNQEDTNETSLSTSQPRTRPSDSSNSAINNFHDLEDTWNGIPPPKWGENVNLTINTTVPYYYNHGDVFIRSGPNPPSGEPDYGWNDDSNYLKVSGDLNMYKQGEYLNSAYDALKIKVYNPSFPRYEYTNLTQTITGYVIIPAGAIGNNEDLYVKEPGALLEYKKKNNWFNKAGIKITLQNSRFSSSGYLILSNNTGAYYYIGSLLPDTYNVIVTLPPGWKLSPRKINQKTVTVPYVRKNTYGDNSLWIYVEPK